MDHRSARSARNEVRKLEREITQYVDTKCLNSDYVPAHALSIPLYPGLREEEIEHVAGTLKAVLKKQLPS